MTSSAAPRPTIVVGVDGSPSSVQALRWALDQAGLTGGEVHAVSVWHLPTTAGWETVLDAIDWSANARLALDTALQEAAPGGAPQVHRHVVEGPAARSLVESAADADLLVVGNRGRGASSGRLMGSVGLHVLAHAPCPVVVVHGERLPSGHEPVPAATTAAPTAAPTAR